MTRAGERRAGNGLENVSDVARGFAMRTMLAAVSVLVALPALAEDWPAWRGPEGSGRSTGRSPPLTWSSTENVRWKTPLPGPGNSTPIVSRGRIFLTQATEGGK